MLKKKIRKSTQALKSNCQLLTNNNYKQKYRCIQQKAHKATSIYIKYGTKEVYSAPNVVKRDESKLMLFEMVLAYI